MEVVDMSEFENEKKILIAEAEKFRDAAFPVTLELQYQSNPTLAYRATSKGISKLEYFSGLAMQGFLANSYSNGASQPLSEANKHDIAELAVDQAKALIKRLERLERGEL
jgi:hypothetical protein